MARAYGPEELGRIEISKEEKFDYWLSLINKDLLEQNEHRWFAWHSVFTEVELSEEFCQEIIVYQEILDYLILFQKLHLFFLFDRMYQHLYQVT